jgi:hypothetical protein
MNKRARLRCSEVDQFRPSSFLSLPLTDLPAVVWVVSRDLIDDESHDAGIPIPATIGDQRKPICRMTSIFRGMR